MQKPDIIARKQARELGLTKYFTGVPCVHGHLAERFVSNGTCEECAASQCVGWRKANPEHHKAKALERKRSDQYREYSKRYKQLWYERNLAHAREYARQYAENAPAKRAANEAKRRARMSPPKAYKWIISLFYEEARVLKDITGNDWHVDHIVPLRGKTVCGLHLPWNLQTIRSHENMRKHNAFIS